MANVQSYIPASWVISIEEVVKGEMSYRLLYTLEVLESPSLKSSVGGVFGVQDQPQVTVDFLARGETAW